LNETVDDFKDIFNNFLGLNEITKEAAETNKEYNNTLEGTAIQSNAANRSLTETNDTLKANTTFVLKNEAALKDNFESFERRRLVIKKLSGDLLQATVVEDGYIKKTKIAALETKGLVIAEQQATVATTALTVAWNAFKLALGGILIGGIIIALTKLFEVVSEWVTGAKAAAKENERLAGSFKALQNGIKGTEDVIKVEGQVALNEAKKRGASIVELTALERKNLDDRVQANKDALKTIEKAQAALLRNSTITKEQEKERQKEIDDAIADNSRKAGELRLERILFESNASLNIQKDGYDKYMRELDARIKLEIDKEDTQSDKLRDLLDEKLAARIKNEGLQGNLLKVAQQENSKIFNDALDADAKRLEAYYDKVDQIRIDAIKDAEERETTARVKKYNQDLNALSFDEDFMRSSIEEREEIRKNLEIKADEDILKIRETYFLKRFQQQQDFQLRENELISRGAEVELAVNQQRIDDATKFSELYGDSVFGNKGLKKMMEARFIDLRKAYNDEYTANEEQFRRDEEALRISLENKKLTQEQFDMQMDALGQKRRQNAENNTARQIQLDKLEVDSKRASADMTIQIGQNLAGLIGAIAGKNIKLQKAAAILDAGVSIARIITDTSRGIIAFSASVAPLGPAGIPIAAAYATKAKISAALGIATIVASGIGKLKSIDENSLSNEGGGGGQQSSSTTRGMEKGGMIGGRRHAEGGTLIEAEKGEAILTRGAVNLFGPMLSMMNQAGGGASFNSNLLTTRQDNPILSNPSQEQAPIIVKSYVVEKDMVSQMNKQARLKDLSTL